MECLNIWAPELKKQHREGFTFLLEHSLPNRFNVVDKILSDSRMKDAVKVIRISMVRGGQILPAIRKKYPYYKYVCRQRVNVVQNV